MSQFKPSFKKQAGPIDWVKDKAKQLGDGLYEVPPGYMVVFPSYSTKDTGDALQDAKHDPSKYIAGGDYTLMIHSGSTEQGGNVNENELFKARKGGFQEVASGFSTPEEAADYAEQHYGHSDILTTNALGVYDFVRNPRGFNAQASKDLSFLSNADVGDASSFQRLFEDDSEYQGKDLIDYIKDITKGRQ